MKISNRQRKLFWLLSYLDKQRKRRAVEVISDFVSLEHFVIFGASIENRMFDTAPERQPVIDRVKQVTGQTVKIYEMADEGATTADLFGNIDSKIASLKGGKTLLPSDKTVTCLIHIGGNNVTASRPYTSAQDATVISEMLTQINFIIDRIEAAGWQWMLTTLSFRDYNNACWDNEALGSDPYNQRVINVINAARGKYVYSDGISWADYYTWWYNNNVAWLEYDGIHPTAICVVEGDLYVVDQVIIPLVTGKTPARISKMAYQPRPTATLSLVNTPVDENGQLLYSINLSKAVPWNTRVTLLYTGTAVVGTDYTAGPAQVIIAAGQTSYLLAMQGLSDAVTDGNKALTVTINTTGDGYVRASPYVQTGTFTDGTVAPTEPTTPDQSSGSGSLAVGKKIVLNLGVTNKIPVAGTNTITQGTGGANAPFVYSTDLLNTLGESTDVDFTLKQRLTTGSNSFGANIEGVTGRSFAEITSDMLASSFYGQGKATPGIFTFDGLAPGTYRVLCGATRSDSNTATNARIVTVAFPNGEGASFTYDAASLKTNGTENWHGEGTVVVSASRSMDIAFSNALGSGNYWYVACIVLERLT